MPRLATSPHERTQQGSGSERKKFFVLLKLRSLTGT
jgi:hypothetical protein